MLYFKCDYTLALYRQKYK